jgi:outer membrane protein with beta-barrel domain
MRSISRALATVSVLSVLAVSVAAAQHPQTRKGFWIGFGFGWGSYGVSCDGCSGLGREGSYTGNLRLGGTLSPHLLLGAETIGWSKSEGGSTLTAGNTSLAAFYYPKPAGGVFLSAGVGFSTIQGSSGGSSDGRSGPGFTLGAGYDLRIAANTSITPTLNWVYGHPESGFSHNFYQFGVGITFH